MDKKFIDIGVIKHIQGTNDNGEEYSFLAIDLKQDVSITKKGKPVKFSTYELNGKTLENKTLTITPVAEAVARLKKSLEDGKISEELYNDMVSSFEKRNVKYTLGVSPKAQA